MWLLRLPCVALVRNRSDSTRCTSSLVVVLPLLPVRARIGMPRARRCSRASCWRAASVSGTSSVPGTSAATCGSSTTAAAAPAASAAAAKTLPSKVAPRSAKKIAPGTMCRESVTTRGWAVNRSYRVDVVSMSLRLMPESVSRPVPRRVRPPPGCFAAYRDDPRRSATAAAASAASPAGAPRSGQMNRSPVWYFTSSMYFLMFCSSVRGQIISTSSVSTTMYSFRPLMTATLPSGIEMMLLRVS